MACVLALAAPLCAVAQQQGAPVTVPSPILTVDQDRLFSESAFGRRIAAEIEAKAEALAAENRRIENELIAEERDLTERRATLAPEEFAPLAEAFDEKVQRLRDRQDSKVRDVTRLREQAQQVFLSQIAGVLEEVVRDRGAVAILDRRAIFLSADAIDITDEAIERIDDAIGEGGDLLTDTILAEPIVESPDAPDASDTADPQTQDDGTAPAPAMPELEEDRPDPVE
ncbi:OmpH family outer membrane protein [Tranquillimonas rosea]